MEKRTVISENWIYELKERVQKKKVFWGLKCPLVGGAVASWLVRSTPDRVVRVQVLAVDIVLCSWARHFTLTVPLSTQVHKWVPANLMLW